MNTMSRTGRKREEIHMITTHCTGYGYIGLREGEEVRIKSLPRDEPKVYSKPIKAIVIGEYPKYILLDMRYPNDQHIRMCVHKGQLICGEVLIQRKLTGEMLVGKNVGEWSYLFEDDDEDEDWSVA